MRKIFILIRNKRENRSNVDPSRPKAIVLTAFSRPELLRLSLQSILFAKRSNEYIKIVVWQTNSVNHTLMRKVLDEFENSIDFLFCVDGTKNSPLKNINYNAIQAFSYAFDFLECKWIISLEEDIQLAYDALIFAEDMEGRYSTKRAFRAVNLGSIEPRNEENRFSYSLLRYGPHQHGMLFTRKLWRRFNYLKYLERCKSAPFDSLFGTYMKTGFVVTPNNSRSFDSGRDGTHTCGPSLHGYFEGQKASWLGSDSYPLADYFRRDIQHDWRSDTLIYEPRDSFEFYVRHALFSLDRILFRGAILRLRTNRNSIERQT